jgi:hypothetical protein
MSLQIMTAFMPRESSEVDGEDMGSTTKQVTNKTKRLLYHRDRDGISQNVEANRWKGLVSRFGLDATIKVLELIAEGISEFRKRSEYE